MIRENSVGLGLRFQHFDHIIKEKPNTDWFEVIADDFLSSGPHWEKLQELCKTYPIVMHSVGLNIGGTQKFVGQHLKKYRTIYDTFSPLWISDHLCWSAHNGFYHHDLLPIPKTHAALQHASDRINYLQDFFSRGLCIENITAYIDYTEEDYSEIDFIARIIERTQCSLLLDISNVLINHLNRNKNPIGYLQEVPLEAVKQVHLAGGQLDENGILDSHSRPVQQQDISWLKTLVHRGLKAPVLIERDDNIPDFSILEQERGGIKREISSFNGGDERKLVSLDPVYKPRGEVQTFPE